jgi:hypothetical protein
MYYFQRIKKNKKKKTGAQYHFHLSKNEKEKYLPFFKNFENTDTTFW